MKLNVMFTLAAASFFLMREVGVLYIGLGLVAWLVGNSDASKVRDGVALGFTIFNTLFALLSLYTQLFTDAASAVGWVAFIIQGLFAVGFFMAGKASMLETAK